MDLQAFELEKIVTGGPTDETEARLLAPETLEEIEVASRPN